MTSGSKIQSNKSMSQINNLAYHV